ncbi:MAG TPA: zinc metalloprotease HtpX [Candidatus Binatia bacterium]|jgi:heat shock protein HtpX|nr:zinc metalloprotease HtpX [Candidatus Binatia bacterium]
MSNALKTVLLLGLLTGLLLWVGQLVGGTQGLVVGFVIAAAMNLGSYWFSDRIVLAMYGAREVSEADAPDLFRIVRELAAGAHMPMPRVYVVQSDSPNAFATGRSPEHAAVAVTEGILHILTPDELRGVLAHELSHVRNRDTLISAIAATLAGVVMLVARLAYWGALFGGMRRDERDEGGGALGLLATIIVAPLAATLIQLAISRAREYQADSSGAQLSHSPLSLASALQKIARASGRVPLDAGPATAHLWIVNPLSRNWLASLFSTHPPIEERIRRLRAMAY